MKIIKCLSEQIEEEWGDAKNYIEKALKYKEEYPDVANLWFRLSNEEVGHANALHEKVVNMIQQYRKEKGEPPEKMMFVYEYLHEK